MSEGVFTCQTCGIKYSKEEAKKIMYGGDDETASTALTALTPQSAKPVEIIPANVVNDKYIDKTLRCKDCGAGFIFSANEQEFYAARGFTNEPQRCKPCRDARKTASDSQLKSMSCPKCNTKSLSHGKDAGLACVTCGATYSIKERMTLEAMEAAKENELFLQYPAKCSACGKETELAFKPKTDRPIYCKDCFTTNNSDVPVPMKTVTTQSYTHSISSQGYLSPSAPQPLSQLEQSVGIVHASLTNEKITDRAVQCKDCGKGFVFTKDEQEFYNERGFTSEPKQCKSCRDKWKQAAREKDAQEPTERFSLGDITCNKCNTDYMIPIEDGGLCCKSCGTVYSSHECGERFDKMVQIDRKGDLQHFVCYKCNEKRWGILVTGQSDIFQGYAIICKFCGKKYTMKEAAEMVARAEMTARNNQMEGQPSYTNVEKPPFSSSLLSSQSNSSQSPSSVTLTPPTHAYSPSPSQAYQPPSSPPPSLTIPMPHTNISPSVKKATGNWSSKKTVIITVSAIITVVIGLSLILLSNDPPVAPSPSTSSSAQNSGQLEGTSWDITFEEGSYEMRYVYTFEEGVLIFTSYNLTTGESFTTRNKYSLSGNKLTVTDEFGESQTVDIYYGEDYLYIDVGLVNRIW